MFSFGTQENENLAATLQVLHKNPLEGVAQLSRTKLSFSSGNSLLLQFPVTFKAL